MILALFAGEAFPEIKWILISLILGFLSYGISVCLYIYAQRFIGAAKTSAYYAINPFIAAIFSLIIFLEIPNWQFVLAIIIMAIGAWLASSDKPLLKKKIKDSTINNIEEEKQDLNEK